MAPPNHEPRQTSRSNPQIDPSQYQILYEMERRMDERFEKAREQYKEDMATALVPVMARLDAGNRIFCDHDSRIKTLEDPATTALEKKKNWVSKLGEKIILPTLVAALSAAASIWLMVQIKLVALSDTTTNTPVITQPAVTP